MAKAKYSEKQKTQLYLVTFIQEMVLPAAQRERQDSNCLFSKVKVCRPLKVRTNTCSHVSCWICSLMD